MPGLGRSLRPRIEAQLQLNLLMELYDKGRGLDAKSKVDAINKFLANSQPGVEKQIQWGFWFKADRAEGIINKLRSGLDALRDGKPLRDQMGWRCSQMRSRASEMVHVGSDPWTGCPAGSRDPRHLFLTRVFELLTEVAPWLRVCQRKDCRKFFLFQRPKQIYCSDVCAQRVRMERFLAQRAPSRPPQANCQRDGECGKSEFDSSISLRRQS